MTRSTRPAQAPCRYCGLPLDESEMAMAHENACDNRPVNLLMNILWARRGGAERKPENLVLTPEQEADLGRARLLIVGALGAFLLILILSV